MNTGKVILINIKQRTRTPPKNTFYIGRGSLFGNPYKISSTLGRKQVIECFTEFWYDDLIHQIEIQEKLYEMIDLLNQREDVYLSCFCAPLPCHGDVIKSTLESTPVYIGETIIRPCPDCRKHEQDLDDAINIYGPKSRLMNVCLSPDFDPECRCTVCGTVHRINTPQQKYRLVGHNR